MKNLATTNLKIKQVLDSCEPSYAETIGIIPEDPIIHHSATFGLKAAFDWVEALTSENPNWEDLKIRANNWPTCACGNQCSILSRDSWGAPEDSILFELGLVFSGNIGDNNPLAALRTLALIEERSAWLIAKIKGIKI